MVYLGYTGGGGDGGRTVLRNEARKPSNLQFGRTEENLALLEEPGVEPTSFIEFKSTVTFCGSSGITCCWK